MLPCLLTYTCTYLLVESARWLCSGAVELPFTCTFEVDDCRMTALSGNFSWTRHSGTTVTLDTGPSAAFEGLYYAYTEASFPRVPGDTA